MALMFLLIIFIIPKFTICASHKFSKETFIYKNIDNEEIKMDKIVDISIKNKVKSPIFLYVHGGGFINGSRINILQQRYCKHFAEYGYTTFLIDYRLGIKESTPELILNASRKAFEDLIDATNYIIINAKKWNLDTNKFIISGGSAGAITCVTAEYEILNDNIYTKKLPPTFNYAGIISHSGCIMQWANKLTWKKIPCPMMLMHGNADLTVPFDAVIDQGLLCAGSNYIHDQLKELNISHYFHEEDGADHIVATKPMQYNLDEIDTFLKKFVYDKTDSIVYQLWKDKIPMNVDRIADIVPLYVNGWRDDDGFYTGNSIKKTTIIIIAVCGGVFVFASICVAIIVITKKKSKENKNIYQTIE